MTGLERRALLGDRQAQEECTKQKITLPCPLCGEQADIVVQKDAGLIICKRCKLYKPFTIVLDGVNKARRAWNTRAAPPIGRCGECKHSTNPAALTMIYGEPGTLTCHHGPCNRRNVNKNDFCSYFEPKGGEENGRTTVD